MSADDMVVLEPNLVGRLCSVTSMSMSIGRRPDLTTARKRVPTSTGPSVSFSERSIRGLYVGSLRWSATNYPR